MGIQIVTCRRANTWSLLSICNRTRDMNPCKLAFLYIFLCASVCVCVCLREGERERERERVCVCVCLYISNKSKFWKKKVFLVYGLRNVSHRQTHTHSSAEHILALLTWLTITNKLTNIYKHTHTHTLSLSLSRTHTHTHTHTHTLTHTGTSIRKPIFQGLISQVLLM